MMKLMRPNNFIDFCFCNFALYQIIVQEIILLPLAYHVAVIDFLDRQNTSIDISFS